MTEKTQTDLKTFIENVNKKEKKHNGKKIQFAWCKRRTKRRGC